ncbi:Wzz/FepE/Etk N-terminal domain-containing protein [Kitasatospora sp. NPDC050463]|uniref:Wzz/FepE/Etk N-terminal domain-containing protein n=1 Tax=Kitasatospora sp. NPDC050463 TaxID=3155786 RepID=UPI0033EE5FB4
MSEPRRSVRSLARRWWPVVLAVPLGAAAGAGYAVVAHPSYAANSYVIVVPESQGESATAINFAQAYGRLAGQPQVLAAAAAETGHSRAELEALVHGTTSPDAPMIEITGTGARPPEAVRAADAVARSLVAFANASTKETGVQLVPLAPAAEPDKPTTPSAQLDVAVGAAAGVLIGALVMMTRRRGTEPTPAAVAASGTGTGPAPTTPRPRSEEAPARAAGAPAEPTPSEQPATGAAPAEKTVTEKTTAEKTAAEKTPTKEKSAAGSGR